MAEPLHILKLCVGVENVEQLVAWQQRPQAQSADGLPRHVTRMWPKRAAEVTGGGSLYWVIKGLVLARQRILRLEEVTRDDGIRRCGLVLDTALHRTEPAPRRPFQGWRYLAPEGAPRDFGAAAAGQPDLPPALMAALAEIGVR